jgi:antitoxin component of MazEF toxin-antitoxin module
MEQFRSKIRKVGNSFVVTIPIEVYTKLELCEKDEPIFLISKNGKK